MAGIETEQFSYLYSVREVSHLTPKQTVEGYIAYARNTGPGAFMDAVESLEEKVAEGVIGVLAGEFSYNGSDAMLKLLNAGVVFNGLLTFGGVGRSEHIGRSHLSIIARDLEIPLCVAKRPRIYRRSSREWDWFDSGISAAIHTKLGYLTLSKHSRKVELKV